ncbi:hypothetical protein Y032_0075g930 [Ancylostoma ceylanicum]|uniref:Uncharacterized protein n=1 Tax=Ancylostoma ceylanicum TaxID=53326 RepID=A0A016TTZ8_9BILA|nr:hypothetical protein Y032_0075g930 [Ancylostoma ceylanicum]
MMTCFVPSKPRSNVMAGQMQSYVRYLETCLSSPSLSMVAKRESFTYDEEEKMDPGRSPGPKQGNGMRSCGLNSPHNTV